MSLASLKEWVLTLSASASMLAVAVGVWMSLREYRLKLQAEQRQQRSAEVESEIRLQNLFSELMNVANGRSGYQLSEKAVEYLLTHVSTDSGQLNAADLSHLIEDSCLINLPVGSAAQDAAVAAIASLTLRHKELEQPGLCALESLCQPVTSRKAEHYLKLVQDELSARQERLTRGSS